MIILLVGLPGSAKSTVGKQLARKLALCFLDLDELLEADFGCSIRSYFAAVGEAQFREREAHKLGLLLRSELAQPDAAPPSASGQVLSTGGGSMMNAGSRQLASERACVVYLHASVESLAQRLRKDTQRPLLQVGDPVAALRALYALRHPQFLEVAHLQFDTNGRRPSELAAEIAAGIQKRVSSASNSAAGTINP